MPVCGVVLLTAVVALSLVAASQLAVALVNWWLTLLVTPCPLPRMDFSSGIPAAARTVVAVPSMLTDTHGIENLVEALEVRYLANQDANLRYALLTDYVDAAVETLPEDARLLRLAADRIGALNEKYATGRDAATKAGRDDIFFLLHRPRLWNARERVWMGHERKRGKLSDLNALLRGADGASGRFSFIVGDLSALSNVKYVITLDTDTELPRDAARQLAGAMAHPLNRPRYDPSAGARDGRIRHPPAAHRDEPHRLQPLAVRAPFRRRAGDRSLHARRCRTSTRTASAKARSSARASTTSTRSSGRCRDVSPKTASSATTSSRAATRARGSSPTCSCTTTTRRATAVT